jgi:putative ABC transport system substrate-binding protein
LARNQNGAANYCGLKDTGEGITVQTNQNLTWKIVGIDPPPKKSTMPVIGLIGAGSSGELSHLVPAFRQGLSETGFIEGQNLQVEYRWTDNQNDRLPALMADLVSRQVLVIAATGASASWIAAKAATATIPIVLQGGGDPVKLGLVAIFNQPGGNITGVTNV